MLKGKKQMLSYILVLSMMFCTYFSIPIKASAATIDDAEVGAGNQNVIDAQTWLNNIRAEQDIHLLILMECHIQQPLLH